MQPYTQLPELRKRPSPSGQWGASLVEYALLVMLLSLAAFLAVRQFGAAVRGSYEDSTERINEALGG